ncbi:MAG: PucR family transcriptional regulator [Streptosporangiales bacterium]|nr:PucR family transcriptional regulator [Streptosporangiales bacterium]
MRLASTGTLTYGLSVGEVLGASSLADARLIAGASGLARIVQRLNVMEVPDILAWVKPHELLLTTGYPLRNTPQSLGRLVADLDERGLAALAIKLGRYLDDLPPEMIEQADRLGFPLILLPGDVGFDDILNQVLTDILNRQASTLVRAEEIHRALVQIVLGGGGLQEIAEEMASLLGAAVVLTDVDGRILVSAGSPEGLAALRESPWTERDGRVRPPERHGVGGPYAVVPVVAGGFDHGSIVAYGPPGALRETDVHALERAATVAALVITKQQAVAAVESKYRADFLRDVLVGRAGGEERVTQHAASLGWDLGRPVVVVVAELDPETAAHRRGEPDERAVQDRFMATWMSAVRNRDPRAAVAAFSHEVVTVAGATASVDVARLVREATAAFTDHSGLRRSFSVGVSRTAPSPSAMPGAYEQAVRAVRVGRQLHGPGAVAYFDQLGVYRLLSLVPDTAELHAFVRETLGELADEGDAEASDLRQTLQMLLETNLNVAETARRLHFHYNTLRYRIGKLERLLGPFTEDAHLRLNLTLALHVLRMRGI